MAIAISASVRKHAVDRPVPNVQPQRFRRSTPDTPGVVWMARILPAEARGDSANLSDTEDIILIHNEDGYPLADLPRLLDTSDAKLVSKFLKDWVSAGGAFSLTTGAAAKAYDETSRRIAEDRSAATRVAAAQTPRRNSLGNIFSGKPAAQTQASPAAATSAATADDDDHVF